MSPEFLNLILQMQRSNGVDPRAAGEFLTRGTWSDSEDELLRNSVGMFGTKKWTDVAKRVPGRTAKQCRERWLNRLCPDVNHEPFAPWEDAFIVEKQKEMGNRWSVIARMLPGRSTNAVKNRWYSALKGDHARAGELSHPLYSDSLQPMPFASAEYRDHGPPGNDL
jgi:hypothetical protein